MKGRVQNPAELLFADAGSSGASKDYEIVCGVWPLHSNVMEVLLGELFVGFL